MRATSRWGFFQSNIDRYQTREKGTKETHLSKDQMQAKQNYRNLKPTFTRYQIGDIYKYDTSNKRYLVGYLLFSSLNVAVNI